MTGTDAVAVKPGWWRDGGSWKWIRVSLTLRDPQYSAVTDWQLQSLSGTCPIGSQSVHGKQCYDGT